ncbi:MAG: hypothetical protein NVS1B2_16030 [Vulcanimicrobiaceae bacterium]
MPDSRERVVAGRTVKATQKGTRRASDLDEARNEISQLRKLLDLEQKYDSYEEWGEYLPQAMRDEMASRALLTSWGQTWKALALLGFDVVAGSVKDQAGHLSTTEIKALAERIFGTDGVKTIVARGLLDIEEQRSAIVRRTAEIAVNGSDEASVRATQMVAKLAGWTGPEVVVNAPQISLYTLVNAGKTHAAVAIDREKERLEAETKRVDPLAILAHEPGDPVRIFVDDEHINDAASAIDDDEEATRA